MLPIDPALLVSLIAKWFCFLRKDILPFLDSRWAILRKRLIKSSFPFLSFHMQHLTIEWLVSLLTNAPPPSGPWHTPSHRPAKQKVFFVKLIDWFWETFIVVLLGQGPPFKKLHKYRNSLCVTTDWNTESCMGEQASLEFDLNFGDVLLFH